MKFTAADRLCRIANPLDWTQEQRDLMVAACREMAAFHYGASPDIRHLYDRNGFDPQSIRTEADIERIPAVGVTAMKHYLMLSMPEEQAVLKLTSSGTRGQKTRIWFDADSLDRVQSTLDTLWTQEGLMSDQPTNYLGFVHDPDDADDLGIAFSCKNEERFAPAKRSFYALKKDSAGGWKFDLDRMLARVREYEAEGLPVRITGIPAFLFEFVEAMRDRGERPVRFAPGSLVMTGGGWKAAEDKKVSREELRRRVSRFFGIPDSMLRDGYGMAEHSAPYMECREHRFHIPVYNRVIPRHPATLKPLPKGEAGLLELICPYNTLMPNLAILSTDLGKVDAEPCPCGWNAPTFTLMGRAGLTKHKGCAITAAETAERSGESTRSA
ncbi:MAG TPA: acyl-protein synthetase [Bdellovibrionota bacterium]|jgi:phenylacetate-coenzyme A ligase PaaK-like adenylate-forming protein|nr:acyl-protein synthetase [Bdellovibrionota bacterium]